MWERYTLSATRSPMARESSLWQRMKKAGKVLAEEGHKVDLQRLENAAGAGHPDVEGCIDGVQVWIELKSELRPKRPSTMIRPKCRDSQRDWHKARSEAGCRTNFVLLQVGEAYSARLYLIPGNLYTQITAIEADLDLISCINPALTTPADMLLRATLGW